MTGTHGGDWAGYETEYGFLPLDFSANISRWDCLREYGRRQYRHCRMQSGTLILSAGDFGPGWLKGTASRRHRSSAETAPRT